MIKKHYLTRWVVVVVAILAVSPSICFAAESQSAADPTVVKSNDQDAPTYLDDAVLAKVLGETNKNNGDVFIIDPNSPEKLESYNESFNKTLEEINNFSINLPKQAFHPSSASKISGGSDLTNGGRSTGEMLSE